MKNPPYLSIKSLFQNKRKLILTSLFSFLSIILFFSFQKVNSDSSGVSGDSNANRGCQCHGSSQNSTSLSLAFAGKGTFLKPSTTYDMTLTVSNSIQLHYCGVDISVTNAQQDGTNIGTFTPGPDLQIMNGELTHSTKQSLSGGKYDYTFSWTSPSTPGSYYLKAAGCCTNGTGTSNSQWYFYGPQPLNVADLKYTAPSTNSEFCVGSNCLITWNSGGIFNVKIELSIDSGNTFPTTIIPVTPSQSGSYTWVIPASQTPSTTCMLKISTYEDPNLFWLSPVFNISSTPQIVYQPQSRNMCLGQTTNLSIYCPGPSLSYQWRKGAVNVGTNSNTLTFTNVKSTDAGDYYCVVTNTKCSKFITSSSATVTVIQGVTIDTQPASQGGCIGGSVTFTPAVTGGSGLTYQWQKDGVDIAGANSLILKLDNIVDADAGQYSLNITNPNCNMTLSTKKAILTINEAPKITIQPKSSDACTGQPFTFSVTATGKALSYQWRRNLNPIANATASTYTIPLPVPNDISDYDVIVTGSCYVPIISDVATITAFQSLPVIVSNPSSITVKVGNPTKFSIDMGKANILTYIWTKNGDTLVGQNSNTLLIDTVKYSDSGNYHVFAKHYCGTIASSIAKLTVSNSNVGPLITSILDKIFFDKVLVTSSVDLPLKSFITNRGDEDLKITDIKIDPSSTNFDEFGINSLTFPILLTPGKSQDLTFKFTPKSIGAKSAKLIINSNSVKPNDVFSIDISGEGVADTNALPISLSDTLVNFGNFAADDSLIKYINIFNKGKNIVKLNSYQIELPFSIKNPSFPVNILPKDSLELDIQFAPKDIDVIHESNLLILMEGQTKPLKIKLSGTGHETSVDYLNSSNDFVKIAPNPNNDKFPIRFTVNGDGAKGFLILDSDGRLMEKLSNILGNGSIEWNGLDTHNNPCSSGVYFLRFKVNGEEKVMKFILNR